MVTAHEVYQLAVSKFGNDCALQWGIKPSVYEIVLFIDPVSQLIPETGVINTLSIKVLVSAKSLDELKKEI